LSSLSENELSQFQTEVGGKKYEWEDLLDLLVNTWLVPSRWAGKKDIASGAIYMNEEKVKSISDEVVFQNNVCLLKKWKKKYAIVNK
jgi:tyrosyl-tRNA synthetase